MSLVKYFVFGFIPNRADCFVIISVHSRYCRHTISASAGLLHFTD